MGDMKLMPQAQEAEKSLLGTLLNNSIDNFLNQTGNGASLFNVINLNNYDNNARLNLSISSSSKLKKS